MAFNAARFNLTPFNAESGKSYRVRILFSETVSCSIGTASQINALVITNERVTAAVSGERTRKISAVMTETVSEQVRSALTSIVAVLSMSEAVSNETEISADIAPAPILLETVTPEIGLGSVIRLDTEQTETVTADISLGSVTGISAETFELVDASISVIAVDMKICRIGNSASQFVLRPGERLVIDADNYNILVNGENGIWYQSGDWLDELNRETTSITISAASGASNLSATILYTERYL